MSRFLVKESPQAKTPLADLPCLFEVVKFLSEFGDKIAAPVPRKSNPDIWVYSVTTPGDPKRTDFFVQVCP